jgi:hypothetical protein
MYMADNECSQACPLVLDLAERVSKVENDVHEIDKKESNTNLILGRLEVAFTENTRVTQQVQNTLIGLQAEMQNNANITNATREDIRKLNEKYETSEDKSKVDFREVWKGIITNRLTYLLGGGLLVGALAAIGTGFVFIITNIDKVEAIWNILFKTNGI